MSLDWRVDKIEGYKHVCWTGTGKFYEEKGKQKEHTTLKPETEALVWATLSVSMHSITKKNWREFYLRMLLNPYLMSKTRHVNRKMSTGTLVLRQMLLIKVEQNTCVTYTTVRIDFML